MKLPRIITRRRVKWAGTIGTVALAGLFVISMRVRASFLFHDQPTRFDGIWIEFGRATIGSERDSKEPFEWAPQWQLIDNGHWRAEFRPEVHWYDEDLWEMRSVVLPLWLPLLLIAAPTAWLWHTDRRAKPWQCPKCRYDLRRLAGGVCPECGESVTQT